MSPVGDITIYESQLFRAYGAPTAAIQDFHSKYSTTNQIVFQSDFPNKQKSNSDWFKNL